MTGGLLTKTSWLTYSTLEKSQAGNLNYTSLSDYNLKFSENGVQIGDGLQRQEQANMLYNYLIYTANRNAITYENGTATSKTRVTLYTNATDTNVQPIILIEKLPEQVKEFDLALSKYVTKVDGVELSGSNSRVPNIDLSTLETGTTATYKHRKDPVVVKTGSVVTYNLTVYNEGDKSGRATKIVDQLPTGLKFSKLNTSDFSANYDENTNRLTIVRYSDNKNNIRKIFHDFDYKYILNTDPDIFTSRLKQIKCGNRAIKKQMQSLNYNINVLLKIEAKYGTIDNYISSDEPHIIAKQISSGCYKLKQIGFPLAMEYLRNVGIDTIKPDVHICRILGSDRLGFSNCSNAKEKEAVEIIKKLSNNSNLSLSEIDYILWQFCADGYAEICTKNPKCKLCRASSYCHYNK